MKCNSNPFVASVLVASFALSEPLLAATVTFNDGQAHTIPGDPAFSNGDNVVLSSLGTTLNVQSGASLKGVSGAGRAFTGDLDTVLLFSGGTFSGGDTTSFADASSSEVDSRGGSGIYHWGSQLIGTVGTVAGGSADSNGTFSGGWADLARAEGGGAFSAGPGQGSLAAMTVTGGTATATNSGTETIVVLPPPFPPILTGGHASADGGVGFSVSVGTYSLESSTITGGTANSTTLGAGTASATGGMGVTISVGGNVTITGGQVTGGNATAGSTGGGWSSATGGRGLGLFQNGQVTILGGSFTGGSASAADSAEGGPGISIFRHSKARIVNGTFTGGIGTTTESTPVISHGNGIEIGTQINGPLDVQIEGGTFTGAAGLFSSNQIAIGSSLSRVVIRGGDFVGLDGIDLVLRGPTSTFIVGSDFMLDGNPTTLGAVSALSGILAGRLESGALFEWAFTRQMNTPLTLVPEPCTQAFLASVIGILFTVTRRHYRVARA